MQAPNDKIRHGTPHRAQVLHLTTWYPSADGDISGTFVREHVQAAMRSTTAQVIHIAWSDPQVVRPYRVRRTVEPEGPVVWRLSISRSSLSPLWLVVGTIHVLRRYIAGDGRPDLIHSHTLNATAIGALAGLLLRRPLVATEHWTGFLPGGSGHSPIRKVLARLAFSRTRYVLPVGPVLGEGIRQFSDRRQRLVPNVVDASVFRPSLRRDAGAKHVILVVARLSENKRVDRAIRCAAALGRSTPGVRLVVLGDGPERSRLERLAAELEATATIDFRGLVSKREVAMWLRRARLLLITSELETFSVVAAEAMCCGVPVITTRCGGPEYLVDELSGIIVEDPTVDSLLEATTDAMARTWDSELIRERAVRRFSMEAVGAALADVYGAVLGDR